MNDKTKYSRHGKFWTAEEDRILQEVYLKKRRRDIAKLLRRTAHAISTRARNIGIARVYRDWTVGELKFLEKNYAKISNTELALRLERSAHAIASKAFKFKLYKSTIQEPKNIQYLQRWYGKKSIVEIAKHLNYSGGMIYETAKQIGLPKNIPKRPWTSKEINYVREHIQTMSHRELAKRLKRTELAIGQLASRRGWIKNKKISLARKAFFHLMSKTLTSDKLKSG